MRLTFGYVFAAATLASGCSATWKFRVDNHFDSQVRLVHTNGKVPMVYDEANDQVLRVLPANYANPMYEISSGLCKQYKQSFEFLKNI